MENVKINVKATNIDLTPNIKSHIDDKISSIIKFMKLQPEQEAIFDVEVGKITSGQNTGQIMRSEINLELSGQFYRTESVKENIFEAIDDTVSEMTRRVRKAKEKRFDLVRRGATKIKNLFRRG